MHTSQNCPVNSTVQEEQLALRLLAADPCVLAVYPDRRGKLRAALMVPGQRAAAAAAVAPAAAAATAATANKHRNVVSGTAIPQQQPGIRKNIQRVNATQMQRNMLRNRYGAAAVAVAVIDTGIAEHPDIPSIVQSIDCIGAGRSQESSMFTYAVKDSVKGPVKLPVNSKQGSGLGCRKLNKHFDPMGHGTMVAGILAARSSNIAAEAAEAAERQSAAAAEGMNGVAPGTPLYALHVVKPDADHAAGPPYYSFTLSDVIAALEWVLLHNAQQQQQQQQQQWQSKIRVVNLSLGDYSVSTDVTGWL
jgi:subtilisin family serine protease